MCIYEVMERVEFSELKGKIINRIEFLNDQQDVIQSWKDCVEIKFYTDDQIFSMFHEQDCCEDVSIDDITGDIQNLIGTRLVYAEESIHQSDHDDGSETWTFYKLGTVKGWVDIRWYGVSNGYYSEKVSLFVKTLN